MKSVFFIGTDNLRQYQVVLEELYGSFQEFATPTMAFNDGLITADELVWLLDL